MSKFYVKFDNGSACKNKAQEAVYSYVRGLDGTLLSDQNTKQDFIKEIKVQIDLINREFRRCGDVGISTWKMEGENVSFGGGICCLRIYTVKKEI